MAVNPYRYQAAKNTTGYGGAPVASALASNPFNTDPGYLAALASEQTGSQQADAALKAAQEQAIVQFGDPSLAQAAGIHVNPLTAAAAQQNTQSGNSTVAGYQRTRDQNQQTILSSLAAHGMLDSGQLGYATGQNQQKYGRDVYGGLQTALAGLNTAQATDVLTKQGLHSDVVTALGNAYDARVKASGGANAAANTAATQPVTAALGADGPTVAGPITRAPRTATPRAAAANPYTARTAMNVRAG